MTVAQESHRGEDASTALLSLDLPARPESGAEARRALRQTLRSHGADEYLLYSAQVGITEALRFLILNTDAQRITISGQLEGEVLAIILQAQSSTVSAGLYDDALATQILEAVADDIAMTLNSRELAITMRFSIV